MLKCVNLGDHSCPLLSNYLVVVSGFIKIYFNNVIFRREILFNADN